MDIPNYMSSYHKSKSIQTSEGVWIECIAVEAPFQDTSLITSWAQSFRLKYISDEDLLESMADTGATSKINFLQDLIYPKNSKFKNGDFGEILVAEYLMYLNEIWVPTLFLRYSEKATNEESVKGSDIIGIRFKEDPTQESDQDLLCICEVKTGVTGYIRERLQDAVNDSDKDDLGLDVAKRGSVGLNAVKLKMKRREHAGESGAHSYREIARFQNPVEHPYEIQYIAAAVVDQTHFNKKTIEKIKSKKSQHFTNLRMVAVGVKNINKLIEALYSELGVANIGNE